MAKRVAVVTGSNKGIGLAIVRGLCKAFDGDVILTARNEGRGQEAVETLEKEGLKPKFHVLDITDHKSIVSLRDYLKVTYAGLDILVNNAAILYSVKDTDPIPFQQTETIKVNYFSNLDVCQVLFPLLRPHARVCNLSSLAACGGLARISPELKSSFLDPNLTIENLSAMMKEYVNAAQENKLEELGYMTNPKGGFKAYAMSKLGWTLCTSMQQRELDARGADDIVVNCVGPGFVKTDMARGQGTLSPDEGADTCVYVSLLPPNTSSPRGKMLRERQIFEWTKVVVGEDPTI